MEIRRICAAVSFRSISAMSAEYSAPFLQPTPSTIFFGARLNGFADISREIHSPYFPLSSRLISGGRFTHSNSEYSPIFSPRSTAAAISLAAPRSSKYSPLARAKQSGENLPPESVAVVITGCAPTASAMDSARRFAPPRCPESSDIAYFPQSSSTTTAGSDCLECRFGATALTAIPQAQTNISASNAWKTSATVSDRLENSETFPAAYLWKQNRVTRYCGEIASAIRPESSAPRPVTENTAALMCAPLPGGIPWRIRCRKALTAHSRR